MMLHHENRDLYFERKNHDSYFSQNHAALGHSIAECLILPRIHDLPYTIISYFSNTAEKPVSSFVFCG